ncbi:site-specific integrase [Zobellia laminariae]|uniref:site-specific integrase n=1 Tax=Zobellia laminariae TaxID=248906 RepID=UPI0012D9FFD8|nr:site-specific integrase [Zobellia laminariae]
MRTNLTFSISFFVRKKKNSPEQALLYVRITVNGRSKEISLKHDLPFEKWNQSAGKMQGNGAKSRLVNRKVETVRTRLHNIYEDLIKEERIITSDTLKERYLGQDVTHNTMGSLLDYHNDKMKKVLKYGTLKNYTTTSSYLRDYVKKVHKSNDIYLKRIDYGFTLGFEDYLRERPGLHNNGVMKHMERFKKLMRLAFHLEWIEKNPTLRFKLRFDRVDMVYLDHQELERVRNGQFERTALTVTRDIFVFCCYTGLAYADVRSLKREHVRTGIDGTRWIYIRRMKTDTQVRIPLLEEADTILERYRTHPKVINQEILLPVCSNQKTNQYLRDIADALNIRKKLSFHAARHTFATTVTLANGVPIETVSKLLGHHKISTTQIYARVVDTKISNDIDALRTKLRA